MDNKSTVEDCLMYIRDYSRSVEALKLELADELEQLAKWQEKLSKAEKKEPND